MRHVLRNAIVAASALALTFTSAARPAPAGEEFVSLSHLAPALGYTYTWIAAEGAVALTRPGLYVLVRTGNPLYDVNDSVESTAQAPRYRDNDIYVGAGMAARLRSLAVKYVPHTDRAVQANPAPGAGRPLAGALTLVAVPTTVSDALVVSGTGPANAPLTITLAADISRDLPRVFLSRHTAATDAEGNFSLQISTAPLNFERSTVIVSVTSLPGISEAHASVVFGQPSSKIAHPADELPRDFRPHR